MTDTESKYRHAVADALMIIDIMMSWEQTEDVVEAIRFERQALEDLRSSI
jgi:hypothetical protein